MILPVLGISALFGAPVTQEESDLGTKDVSKPF